MRIFPALLLFVVLTGCAEMEARRQEEAYQEAMAIDARENAMCMSYGAQPGTPSYTQCRLTLQGQRAQVAANDRAIALQALVGRR